MALLNKFSIASAISVAAFLGLGTVGINPAQAALFKFTFEGEGANGYFIYDDSTVSNTTSTPNLGEYYGAVKDYKVDLGEKGVFQGSVADTLVFLNRVGSGLPDPEQDEFILFVKESDRVPKSEFSISTRFIYPKNALGSYDLVTTVPGTAELKAFPFVDFINRNFGDSVFEGTVQTRIEKVPEPALLPALLGVGAWFIFRRRPRQGEILDTSM
ncbi:PEP-CTERM sorting domain-containing protein [Nostoc sp.]|uniref:PEP-CTERM sorting domain-containing protein n=1 Tax=Nostoc sp. TaxID=1180 RepID=UPI002FFD535E